MILLLLEYLQGFFNKIPSVFFYTSSRMILAAITALFFTLFFGPWFIKKLYELKIGQKIRSVEDCPLLAELHKKKKNTPTMGGSLVLFSMLFSLLLWMNFSVIYTWIFLFVTIWMGGIGAIDDYLKLKKNNTVGLKGKRKFIAQILCASLVSLYLLVPAFTQTVLGSEKAPIAKVQYETPSKWIDTEQIYTRFFVPFYKKPILIASGVGIFFVFLFYLFVITGTSNAVNLTDGLDGLAAGCLIMSALVLAIFAFFSSHIYLSSYLNILYLEGSSEIAVYLFSLMGACLGFLWYNGYPAQVFMGDTGSIGLGGILGVSAVLLRREVLLALVGGVFVMETLSVILQVLSYRYRDKKRIFLCSPLHHHFEYKGWPETKIVLRFWIISLFLAMIGIASLKFQ